MKTLVKAALYYKKIIAQFWSFLFKKSAASCELYLQQKRSPNSKVVCCCQRIVDLHKSRKGSKSISESFDIYQSMARQARLLFLGVGVLQEES